ncbi:acyloxyacyl hydrolase [Thiosulfatihalobacter marinus]|uniref:acyloxyacyl hydrolase n=1 Tax=Thiosulfatihalobacter marinus TaxID=2792481 RepID=UPI0018D62F46|nr:acyloxyacyl hydrolase [Thiosulfatihalobacter marinus]
MKNTLLCGLAALGLAATAAPAPAQEVIVGLGYSDFSLGNAIDSAAIELEYQSAPFYSVGNLSVSWGAVLGTDLEGDAFVGAGIVNKYNFDDRWFAELSLMPGAYFEGPAVNDLGDTLEFRTLLGLGYTLKNNAALSLAFVHKSNAGISTTNPGVNTVLLRYHYRF